MGLLLFSLAVVLPVQFIDDPLGILKKWPIMNKVESQILDFQHFVQIIVEMLSSFSFDLFIFQGF